MECGNMGVFDRGVQMLLTTVGAFAAFSLMTIAVGTDYWLYSRGTCKSKSNNENETSKKNEEVMTHSGLWRTCCLEGKTGRKLTALCLDAPAGGGLSPWVCRPGSLGALKCLRVLRVLRVCVFTLHESSAS